VQAQHVEHDVFAHRLGHVWVDEPQDRDARWQRRVAQDVVDPGAQRHDQAQIRQGREQPRFGVPDQRMVDRRLIADLRPDADVAARQRRRQMRLPAPLRRGGAAEQDCHSGIMRRLSVLVHAAPTVLYLPR
jgi:hypothetical protein